MHTVQQSSTMSTKSGDHAPVDSYPFTHADQWFKIGTSRPASTFPVSGRVTWSSAWFLQLVEPPSMSRVLECDLCRRSPRTVHGALCCEPLRHLSSPASQGGPLIRDLLDKRVLPIAKAFFPRAHLRGSQFFRPLRRSSQSGPTRQPGASDR